MGTIIDDQLESTPQYLRAETTGTTLLTSPVDPQYPILGREWGEPIANAKARVREFATRHFPGLALPRFRSGEDGAEYVGDTAIDRIFRIFERDESGMKSPERILIGEATALSFMVGSFLGMREGVRGVRERFIRIHAATIFANPQHAKRELLNTLVRAGAAGGMRAGLKISMLCFITISTATLVSTARNRSGILEYGVAGATAGFLYRLPMGPRAQFVASLTGGILGAVLGSFLYTVLKASGTTMENVLKARQDQMRDRLRAVGDPVYTDKNREPAIYEHDNLWESVRSELEASGVISKTDALMGQIPNKGMVMPSLLGSTSAAEAKPSKTKQSIIDTIVPIQLVLPGGGAERTTETSDSGVDTRIKPLHAAKVT